MGWTPITIWECELKKDRIDGTMEKVIEQYAPPHRSTRNEPSTRSARLRHIRVINLRKPLSPKPFKSATRYL